MTEKEAKIFNHNKRFDGATKVLEEKFVRSFTPEYLSSLLGHYFERDDVHLFLIFNDNIGKIDLVEILSNEILSVSGYVEFESDEFDFLLEGKIEKATIKSNGYQWVIHKNDADPFPSSPHAHEFNLNVKLDLRTGVMYQKRRQVGFLTKKEFARLKEKIVQKGISLPN